MYSNQSMYPQQQGAGGGGGGGGQWETSQNNDHHNPYAVQPNQYANYGYSQNGGQEPQSLSSASLFQQQLAAQQQRSAHSNPLPPPGNNYQLQAQAYAQSQHHLAQARQNQAQFSNTSQSPASTSAQLPPQSAYPSSQPGAPPTPNQQRQMTGPEIMSVLRGVNIQAMNPQLFATLTPLQQHAMREFIARTRMHQAQQQAQLGLGLPGSPATPPSAPPTALPPSNPTPFSNGTPAPLNAPSPAASNPRPSQPPPSQQSTVGFLKFLGDFCAKRGLPSVTTPVVEGRQLDLTRFYAAVNASGGFVNTSSRRLWGAVATALGFPSNTPDDHPDQRLQQIAAAYRSALYPFEQHVAQMQLERMQAARAAAAAQNANAQQSNNVASPSNAAPPQLQPQPSTSFASPLATQVNLPTPSTSNSTAPVSTQSPRPTSSASTLSPFQAKMPSPVQPKRPSTASSRRESIAPTGDLKGKGKAVGETTSSGSIKVEDFAANGGATTPKGQLSVLPDSTLSASPRPLTANNSAKPSASPLPEPTSEPPRRKRQKIEYVPMSKPQDAVAGYDLAGTEEVLQRTARRKRPRTAHDLGLVDIHSLTMGLRSRLASEVSFALNSLTLISMSIRTYPQEPNTIPFPLSRCRNLYEELVDLLEETAFGFDDEEDEEDESNRGPEREPTLQNNPSPPTTYSELFQLITEEAGQISPPDPHERNRIAELADLGHTPLKPVDILLSVTNILRNLSIAEENSQLMGDDQQLLKVLARIAHLPLRQKEEEEEKTPHWRVRVTPFDSMALKKDVLELVVNFGIRLRLEDHETSTARALFDLFTFFLLDAHRHSHTYFDLSQTPGSASRLSQPSSVRIPHYVDLGLAAFSQVALLDSNRSIISRLASSSILERLFDSLIRLVPVSEADFQILTNESGLVYVNNLVMSLYNLAFLSPPELKLELRKNPSYVRSLMRVVRRLGGNGASDTAAATFQPLLERCISILHLLSTLEGVTVDSSGMESSQVPWWGLSMSGWEEEEEGFVGVDEDGKPRVRPAQSIPTERGTVKQRLPPSASTAAGLDPGLPILSGETMALFEALDSRLLMNVFSSLVTLL